MLESHALVRCLHLIKCYYKNIPIFAKQKNLRLFCPPVYTLPLSTSLRVAEKWSSTGPGHLLQCLF